MGLVILYIALVAIIIAGYWVLNTKANKPGWAAIVPIYNVIVLAEIAGRPAWHALMLLIPFVNIVFMFLIMIDVAKSFGKSTGFGVGMVLLGFVFVPMLAFGSDKYQGPVYKA